METNQMTPRQKLDRAIVLAQEISDLENAICDGRRSEKSRIVLREVIEKRNAEFKELGF